MSSRFDRPGQQPGPQQPGPQQPGPQRKRTDAATMWESLSRDIDPTVEGTTDPAAPVGAAPDRPAPVGAAPLRAAPVGADPDRADQFDGGTRT
jgi:hypothetical protein